MPDPRDVHRVTTSAFAVAMIAIGIAMIVVTIVHGGSGVTYGYIIGPLFVAAGAGRLWVQTRGGGA